MFRKLLGLLKLTPCDCGHDAAVHETPCAYRPWYECSDCADLAVSGADRRAHRLALLAARHPYVVRG